MRLSLKLLLPILAFAGLLAAVIGFHAVSSDEDVLERRRDAAAARVEAARGSFLDKLAQAAGIARLAARSPGLQDAIDARDQGLLAAFVEPFVRFGLVDVLTLYGPDGVVLARGDAPAVSGGSDALAPWLAELQRERDPAQRPWAAVRPDGARTLLVSAAPVATANRLLAAIVVAGFAIDARFLAGLKLRSGVDSAALLDGQPVAATLPAERLADPALSAAPVALADAIPGLGEFALVALTDDGVQHARFRSRLTLMAAVLGVSGLVVIAGSALLTIRAVTAPLAAVTRSLTDLAEGRMDAAIPCLQRRDEIGALARAAERFKRGLIRSVAILTQQERERTAKEQAEAQVRAYAAIGAQMQQVFDASPVPLLLLRGEPAVIVSANHAGLELLEIEEAELGLLAPGDILADPALRQRLSSIAVTSGALEPVDARLRSRGGREMWCSLASRLMTDDGGAALLLGLYDITGRKAAEEALRLAKEKAECALQSLQEAQESLIQAEKMASLGTLVAGIAHEVNTPVGVTLTAASHLLDRTTGVAQAFTDGRLRKSDLADYLDTAHEAARLMVGNSERAAALIQRFKQLAVDQTSEERRRFDLATYIDEVLWGLGPQLRTARHQVSVRCPAGITMDSFPGALSQVLTNFLINSLIHAFPEGQAGRITIDVTQPAPAMVALRYADDGRGIREEDRSKIFDPFFTTNRAGGGSGLGLHIAFNIVTQTLKGQISVETELGRGTAFLVVIPVTVAGK